MARSRRDYSYISQCLKWTLFTFNFVFWLFGLLIAALGCYGVIFTAEELSEKKSLEVLYIITTDLSGILLAIGGVIFMVSFTGCVGALRENLCMLKFYFWSLTIFLIAELMFAIACIVFPWKSREIMEGLLSKRMVEDYRDSDNTRDIVDFIQVQAECCGITSEGYRDWNDNEYFHCNDSSPSAEKCGVPPSCCIDYKTAHNLMCGYDMFNKKEHEAADKIHTRGCVTAIINILESNLYMAAGIIFGITLFQIYVTHQARSLMDQIILQRSLWMRDLKREGASLMEKKPVYYGQYSKW